MASNIPHAARVATGLVGVAKSANPQTTLVGLYKQTLETLAKMPATASYRRTTESLTQDRLGKVEAASSPDEFEASIGHGQAEQLIMQAKDELKLSENMLEWQPWQPLAEEPAPGQWKWP